VLAFSRFGKDAPGTITQRKINIRDVFNLVRYKVMWVCGAIQFIRLATNTGIAFWLPSLLIEDKGLSLQVTGLIIALRAVFTSPSNIVGGYASDKLKNPPLIIGLSLLILAITTPLIANVNSTIILMVVIAINAIFVQFYFGPLFAVPGEVLGTRITGISTGFSNLFANLGAFSTAYILGALRDATGSFESGYYVISGLCVIGLALTLLLSRIRHKAIASRIAEAEVN
jgi:sugar phosphate permease